MATYTTYAYGSRRTDNSHYCLIRYVVDVATAKSGSNCIVTITVSEQIKGNEKPTTLGDGSITVFSKTTDVYGYFTKSTHSLANETVYPSAISGGYYNNAAETCEVGRETFTYNGSSYNGVFFGLSMAAGQYHTTSGPSPNTSSWTTANAIVATFTIPMQHASSTIYIAGSYGSVSPSYLIPYPFCVLNYAANTESYQDTSSYNWGITSDIAITVPAKDTYTIAYNANGGTGAPSSQTKWYGEAITLSSTQPTRASYAFYHWNTNTSNTGTTYNPGASYTANAAATLYAIWNPIISYNANGGTGAPSSQTKTFGTALTLSSTVPTRSGYQFKRWNTSSTDTGAGYSPGGSYASNDAATLYAIWNPIVTFNANGGENPPSAQVKTYGTDLTLTSSTPTRQGFMFQEWNTASDGSGTAYYPGGTYSGESSVTLYAIWSQTLLISAFTLERADATGNPDVAGGYISAVVTWETNGSSEGSTLTVSSNDPSDSITVQISGTSGTTRVDGLGRGEIYPNESYVIWATVTSTDGSTVSRSATSSASETGYTMPYIGAIDASRCDSTGTLDDEGTYAKLTFDWGVAAVGSQTQPESCSVSAYQEIGSGAIFRQALTLTGASGTFSGVVGGNVFDTDKQYYFVIALQDRFYGVNKTEVMPMAYFTFDVLAGGHGVAFGKPATTAELMDVAYEIHSDTEVSATDSNDVVHNLTEKIEEADLQNISSAIHSGGEVSATDANSNVHNLTEKLDAASAVTGVKGNAETDYRLGNVNLTPANIGAVDKTGDTMTGSLTMSGKTIAGVGNIEMNHGVSTAGHGGYIDFHYNASTADYTARLIEAASGLIRCYNNFETINGYLKATNNGNTVQIGSINTGFCHITNSVSRPFYFNKTVHVDGDIYKYNGPRVQYVPTQLYNNTTGSAGAITLSQTAANFNHIRVYYRASDNNYNPVNSVDIYSPNGKSFGLWTVYTTDANGFAVRGSMKYISGTTLGVRGQGGVGWMGSSGSWGGSGGGSANIFVVRVEGWNE